MVRECDAEVEFVFANQPNAILDYTDCIINCDIHTRVRTKRILLGSNKSTEDKVKLFPNECKDLVLDIQKKIKDATGKHVEVVVFGDGAFKEPQGTTPRQLTDLIGSLCVLTSGSGDKGTLVVHIQGYFGN